MATSAKLTVRLTDGEARILRSQAIRSGLSLSAFARRQILHGGSADVGATEAIVSQILPAVEARFDALAEELQSIKSEARAIEGRTAEKLKKTVQIIVEEVRKK